MTLGCVQRTIHGAEDSNWGGWSHHPPKGVGFLFSMLWLRSPARLGQLLLLMYPIHAGVSDVEGPHVLLGPGVQAADSRKNTPFQALMPLIQALEMTLNFISSILVLPPGPPFLSMEWKIQLLVAKTKTFLSSLMTLAIPHPVAASSLRA